MGYAAVGVAPRGKLRSNRHYNPGYPGLLVNNIVDRHTYSYRGFYVDACRAVDFVLTRPEVDRTRIGVHGSSQGGALTITTAALRRDVITCGAAGAPYLCGFMDAASLTHSWPYQEINDYLRLYPERESRRPRDAQLFRRHQLRAADHRPDAGLHRLERRRLSARDRLRRLQRHRRAEGAARAAALGARRRPLLGDAESRGLPGQAPEASEDRMSAIETLRPADFDAYWDALDQDLARYPAAPTLERLALRVGRVLDCLRAAAHQQRSVPHLWLPERADRARARSLGCWLRHTTAASTTCRTWTIASAM